MNNTNNNLQKKYLKCSKNKESRWDRIQKKHINSISPILESSSSTVDKLFNMNFVSNNEMKRMSSSSADCIYSTSIIDPALIMQLRHESVRKPFFFYYNF